MARGMSTSASHVEAGYKANRHNAAALAREEHIRTRVAEVQEEQLAIRHQATAETASERLQPPKDGSVLGVSPAADIVMRNEITRVGALKDDDPQ
jgi:hypothetical protein